MEIHQIHRQNYFYLEGLLENHPNIEIPKPFPEAEQFCDTMQFHLRGITRKQADRFIEVMSLEGIDMQIFGVKRNARDFRQWHFLKDIEAVELPATVEAIEFACDLSLQPHLDTSHMDVIAQVIREVLAFIIKE